MRKVVAAAIGVILMASLATAAAGQTIGMAGFDDRAKAGWWERVQPPWVMFGLGADWQYISSPKDPTDPWNSVWLMLPHSGRGWASLAGGSPRTQVGGAYQVINGLTPGTAYILSAYAISSATEGQSPIVQIGVDVSGGTNYLDPGVIWGEMVMDTPTRYEPVLEDYLRLWVPTSLEFIATGSSATIFFKLDQTPVMSGYTATAVDDFSLTPVPEPMSLAALGSGLIGFMGYALRRMRTS